jgi:lipopolysaccharide export system protein LptA
MWNEEVTMQKNKFGKPALALILAAAALVFPLQGHHAGYAASGTYSVDADMVEYDMKSGDGKTTGVTTLRDGTGTAVAQGGATFNSKAKSGHLYGGVVADWNDQHLRSAELIIYNDKYISAVGDAHLTNADKTLTAPRVDYHDDTKFAETIGGSARLDATDGSWLTAGKITYNTQSKVANATGGVEFSNVPQNMTGSSDTAVYNTAGSGYVELIGNARTTQNGNTVTGRRLRITDTNSPNSRTTAEGNVRIVYYPQENEPVQNVAFSSGATAIAHDVHGGNPSPNIKTQLEQAEETKA